MCFEAVLSGTVLEILNRKLGENCFALNYLFKVATANTNTSEHL